MVTLVGLLFCEGDTVRVMVGRDVLLSGVVTNGDFMFAMETSACIVKLVVSLVGGEATPTEGKTGAMDFCGEEAACRCKSDCKTATASKRGLFLICVTCTTPIVEGEI